jgi:hypothetical protein
MSLVPVMSGPDRTVAAIGGTSLSIVVAPKVIAPPRGGWVVVLDGDAPMDLHRIDDGGSLDGAGIRRALVFASPEMAPEPIPPSWQAPPPPAFAPFEDGSGTIPFDHPALAVTLASDTIATIAIGESRADVARYWFARMLFRVALHPMRLNYVETYGGLFVDDSDGLRMGIRSGASSSVTLADVENLYRAIAPPNYCERLPIS